jgi:Na+-driven multidrug efflux pump
VVGSIVSSWVISKYFILPNGNSDWNGIWLSFAAYSLVVAIFFAIMFKHKHDPAKVAAIQH